MSRERIEEALRLMDESGLSARAAAKALGVSRETIAKYQQDPLYRRVQQRCPRCGSVVRMPCVACSIELHSAVVARHRLLRKAARRLQPVATTG